MALPEGNFYTRCRLERIRPAPSRVCSKAIHPLWRSAVRGGNALRRRRVARLRGRLTGAYPSCVYATHTRKGCPCAIDFYSLICTLACVNTLQKRACSAQGLDVDGFLSSSMGRLSAQGVGEQRSRHGSCEIWIEGSQDVSSQPATLAVKHTLGQTSQGGKELALELALLERATSGTPQGPDGSAVPSIMRWRQSAWGDICFSP